VRKCENPKNDTGELAAEAAEINVALRLLRALRLLSFYPRTYLLNQSIVRCHARSAAALLYRSGVASQLNP
jgi:hypothetical protein